MMHLNDNLFDTEDKHSDMLDSYAYMVAAQYAKLQDDYILLYIKKKPKYIPHFIYRWFLKRFVVVVKFKEQNGR